MGPVDEQKRELCKQAYLLVCKYCAAAGKEGKEACDFRTTLRKPHALDIDKETNKLLVAELTKFKQQGGIAALLAPGGSQSAYGGGGGAAAAAASGVKAARSKGAAGAAAGAGGGASGLPPLGPSQGGSRSAAKPTRSAAKGGSKADGGSMPAQLPPRIGMKVNRWWAKEGQWFTAVITDYNSDTNEYRLTYNLCNHTETYEDFNLDVADPAIYAITGERVNLLAKTGSAAVNNSSVLKPFLNRGGGAGGGSKSKKRRSESSDDDSDYSR